MSVRLRPDPLALSVRAQRTFVGPSPLRHSIADPTSVTFEMIPWSSGEDAWMTPKKSLVRFQPGSLTSRWKAERGSPSAPPHSVWPLRKRAARPMVGRLVCTQVIGVRLLGGPLKLAGSWSNGKTPVRQTGNPGSIPGGSTDKRKVAGYGLPGRTANACPLTGMRVRIPCLPLMARW